MEGHAASFCFGDAKDSAFSCMRCIDASQASRKKSKKLQFLQQLKSARGKTVKSVFATKMQEHGTAIAFFFYNLLCKFSFNFMAAKEDTCYH